LSSFVGGCEHIHNYVNSLKSTKRSKSRLRGDKGFSKNFKAENKNKTNEEWILDNGLPYKVTRNKGEPGYKKTRLKADGINSKSLPRHPIRNATRKQSFAKAPFEASIFYN